MSDEIAAGKDVPTPDPQNSPARNAGEPWNGGLYLLGETDA
jgi:hypothetical protein